MSAPHLSAETAILFRDLWGRGSDPVSGTAAQWHEAMSYATRRQDMAARRDWPRWQRVASETMAWWLHARERERAALMRAVLS